MKYYVIVEEYYEYDDSYYQPTLEEVYTITINKVYKQQKL